MESGETQFLWASGLSGVPTAERSLAQKTDGLQVVDFARFFRGWGRKSLIRHKCYKRAKTGVLGSQ